MKNNMRHVFDMTCSPSHLSTGKRDRAAQLGLNADESEESFECNQSFPRALHTATKLKASEFSPALNVDLVKGYELGSVSLAKRNAIFNGTKNLSNIGNNNNSNNVNKRAYLLNETMSVSSCQLGAHSGSGGGVLDKSWSFYNHFVKNALVQTASSDASSSATAPASDVGADQLLAMTNPNKALVVINGRTTQILTANKTSCELFGYSEQQLIGAHLKNLIALSLSGEDHDHDKTPSSLIDCERLDENGRVVLCSGKIFEAIVCSPPASSTSTDDNNEPHEEKEKHTRRPVAMYMLKLTDESEPRCLCVMEPVERVSGSFAINVKGRIRSYDANFSYIFGYTTPPPPPTTTTNSSVPSSANNPTTCGIVPPLAALSVSSVLIGKDVSELMPAIRLPTAMNAMRSDIREQTLTGRCCCSGENIPLSLNIVKKQAVNKSDEVVFSCTVSVYT